MTPAQKHNYALSFHRFQQSREKFYTPKLIHVIRDQYRQFVFNYPYLGMAAVDKITSEPLVKVLTHLSKDAVQVYGQKVLAHLKQSRGAQRKSYQIVHSSTGAGFSGAQVQLKRMPIGFSQRIYEIMQQYFTIDIINNSEEITATTKEFLLNPRIQQLFIEAYQRGDGIDDIIRLFPSQPRARLIARTETVTAANKSTLVVAKDTGLDLLKEWLPTNDFRTRQHHREMKGQKIGQDDLFNVKSDKGVIYQMDAPGDRGGKSGRVRVPASLVCNCRCCIIHEVVE